MAPMGPQDELTGDQVDKVSQLRKNVESLVQVIQLPIMHIMHIRTSLLPHMANTYTGVPTMKHTRIRYDPLNCRPTQPSLSTAPVSTPMSAICGHGSGMWNVPPR